MLPMMAIHATHVRRWQFETARRLLLAAVVLFLVLVFVEHIFVLWHGKLT